MSTAETNPQSLSNIEAENYVLAYMLLKQEAYRVCVRRLLSADFFDAANRQIFSILANCCGKEPDEPARLSKCWHELKQKRKTIEASRKLASLMVEFQTWAASAPHLTYWLNRVIDVSQRRAAVVFAGELVDAASSIDSDYLEVLEKNYEAITKRASTTERAALVGDTIVATLEQMEDGKVRGGGLLSTGIEPFDNHNGGIARGETICIGGTPGAGKSALGLAVAVHFAQQGRSVAYISLEMTQDQIQKRMLAQLTNVNLKHIVMGTYSREERAKMVGAIAEIGSWKFAVYDRSNVRMRDIYSQVLSHKTDHGLDLVVIDYCQLIKHDSPKLTMYEGLSYVSRDIKVMAKDLNVPVLNLAQLNRESIKAGKPRKEHLKGSGSLAEDSDTILLLSDRDPDPNEDDSKGRPILLNIDKARQGEEGELRLMFDAAHQRFTGPSKEWRF